MEKIIAKSTIIEMFQKKKIRTYYDVPEEFRNDQEIISLQRQLGHRVSGLRGYDVINNEFFVRESVAWEKQGRNYIYRDKKTTFATFDDYYAFLNGDIYENSCYYQFVFTNDLIDAYKVDFEKLNFSVELDSNVAKLKSDISNRKQKYHEAKKKLQERKKWIEKFNEARNYQDFTTVLCDYRKKHSYHDVDFYIWNYLDKYGEESFDIITAVLSDRTIHSGLVRAMCFIYDIEKLKSTFRITGSGAKSTITKYNTQFKQFIEFVKTAKLNKRQKAYFDIHTGYYCVRIDVVEENDHEPIACLHKYIETFEEFAKYLNYDFSDCDFTYAFDLQEESISNYNENTKFPIKSENQLTKIISSGYDRTSNRFYVKIYFHSQEGRLYYSITKEFDYFFEFVSFLNYDLADSNLIFCDGLKNLTDYSNLNIENAKVISSIKAKAGTLLKSSVLKIEAENYDNIENNEAETALILQTDRTELLETETLINDDKVYYITDLHLEHRLNHACCKTNEDCVFAIQKVIDALLDEIKTESGKRELLLIGGDTASNFWIFELFVKTLKMSMKQRSLSARVIFTLGNHELWEFPSETVDVIANKYRAILSENEMYLLQNETLCVFDNGVEHFSLEMSKSKLKEARAIIFGGIGFSGCNDNFNANNWIYRKTVSRNVEIEESNKIKKAYENLCEMFSNEQIIVFTHMPFEDWAGTKERHENYIYVSGHNHRNEYYDDGVIRVYSDNQVGYSKVQPRLKYFYFSYEFDLFEDYEDGIYEITREEYRNFYRGKNLYCNCNCVNEIYLLKKNGYYCFIHKNKSGDLAIMNGGSKRTLKSKDVNYYYDNMEVAIELLKNPFDKYSKVQRQISNVIKKIGGTGKIHGAIIDIDCFNHVYLNPFDLSATPYFATSIVHKIVFPNLGELLESKCPEYYQKYELLSLSNGLDLIVKPNSQLQKTPKLYLNTDIYSASREIKKMQKLNSNILSVWPENINNCQTSESISALEKSIR